MEEKLRRYRSIMSVSAAGIIIFGLWSAIKTIMYYTMAAGLSEALSAAAEELPDLPPEFFLRIFYCMLGVFFLFDISVRLVVGLSAMAESKGRKKGIGYVILAILLLASNLSSFIPNLPVFFDSTGSHLDAIMTTTIELTSIFALGELIYASVRSKLLVRKLNETAR